MNIAFAALFFLGLIFAVRVMLYGVERARPAGDDSPRSFSLLLAVAGASCVAAGVVGYLLTRSAFRASAVWFAGGAGVASGVVTALGVMRWWKVVPEHDIDDERYVLQGSLARVTAAIDESGVGQVSLSSSTGDRVLPARTIDQHAMATGTEVVIERIEDGVAFVEDWAQVEKRL